MKQRLITLRNQLARPPVYLAVALVLLLCLYDFFAVIRTAGVENVNSNDIQRTLPTLSDISRKPPQRLMDWLNQSDNSEQANSNDNPDNEDQQLQLAEGLTLKLLAIVSTSSEDSAKALVEKHTVDGQRSVKLYRAGEQIANNIVLLSMAAQSVTLQQRDKAGQLQNRQLFLFSRQHSSEILLEVDVPSGQKRNQSPLAETASRQTSAIATAESEQTPVSASEARPSDEQPIVDEELELLKQLLKAELKKEGNN